METAWPLLLFLAGLMGMGLLIVICGYQGREQERAEAADLARAPELAGASHFFAVPAVVAVPIPAADESLVRDVEKYLRAQRGVAAHFVERPSIDSFHGVRTEEGQVRSEESVFNRIQEFLERERALAAEFVSHPSLDRFHGQLAAAVA